MPERAAARTARTAPAKTGLSTRIERVLDADAHAWDRLAAASPLGGMFATRAWPSAWLEHVAPAARPALIVVENDGEVIGLAPMCQMPVRDIGLTVPAVRFSGREVVSADYLDVLCTEAHRTRVVPAVFGELEAHLDRGSLVLLGEIVAGSPMDDAIRTWIDTNGYRFHIQERRRCPYVELPATFDAYLKTLSTKFRGQIRRKMRRLQETCDLTTVSDREAVADRLPDLYRLHALRWRQRGEDGTFVRPGFRQFLETFVRRGPPTAEPRLYELSKDGATLATLLVFHCNGNTAMHYQGGWDPDMPFMKHSPGLVLTARAIEDALDAGMHAFDFLRGDEGYKLHFGAKMRHTHTFVIAHRGLRVRAYMRLLAIKERWKRHFRKKQTA